MGAFDKIRDLFRRKPPTEDELRAREEARRVKDERRFRKLFSETPGCSTRE